MNDSQCGVPSSPVRNKPLFVSSTENHQRSRWHDVTLSDLSPSRRSQKISLLHPEAGCWLLSPVQDETGMCEGDTNTLILESESALPAFPEEGLSLPL